MTDIHDLQRFLLAQETSHAAALAELAAGQKQSHWMWFIFPQTAGLGSSSTAVRYAIQSRAEAEAYLGHPVLGARLREITQTVLHLENRTAQQIFGFPDELKFHSSMTLFNAVAQAEPLFRKALAKYFNGERDRLTLAHLR